jgi:hypothetical protein
MPETLAFLQRSLTDDKDSMLLSAARFLDYGRPVSNHSVLSLFRRCSPCYLTA